MDRSDYQKLINGTADYVEEQIGETYRDADQGVVDQAIETLGDDLENYGEIYGRRAKVASGDPAEVSVDLLRAAGKWRDSDVRTRLRQFVDDEDADPVGLYFLTTTAIRAFESDLRKELNSRGVDVGLEPEMRIDVGGPNISFPEAQELVESASRYGRPLIERIERFVEEP